MRARITATVDVEKDVYIDSDDVRQVLSERMVELTDDAEASQHFLLGVCNDVFQVLKAITPQMIARVSDKNRQTVFDGLIAQVNRWEPGKDGD